MQLRLATFEQVKTNNLITRLITGVLLVSIIVGNTMFGPMSFILLFYLINVTGLFEFYRLFRGSNYNIAKIPGYTFSTVLFLISAMSLVDLLSWSSALFLLPLVLLTYIYELYRKNPEPFVSVSLTLFGVIYITVPVICILAIPFISTENNYYSSEFLLLYFSLIWVFDSFAYVFGKKFGRKKLFVRISPNKTWEGFLSASLIVILLGFFYNFQFAQQKINWIIVSMIIICFGTFGDLVKSMLKRSRHVKDSGSIFPGHGGVLDRFDSMFGSAPVVLIYLIKFCR